MRGRKDSFLEKGIGSETYLLAAAVGLALAWMSAGCKEKSGETDGDVDGDAAGDDATAPDPDIAADPDADTDLDALTDGDVIPDADVPDDMDVADDTGPVENLCTGAWGTTYYVRPDGGDADRCTGLADAPYPGSGTGQPCAFSHPFVALPPGGTPVMTGGDRLIIAAGSYRMGVNAPGAAGCSEDYPWDCTMPSIPSGPDADRPTCIVGMGWDSGCAAPPELYGVERAGHVISLSGSAHVRVECLELTDHEGCVEFHSGSITCDRDGYPYGDWAGVGVTAVDSEDVTLRNLNIHGFASRGILAGRLTDWTFEDVRIAGNGWAGFDGDVEGDDSNGGTLAFTRVSIVWNGCGETWPGGEPTGCWGQSAGGYGDGLGTGATGGDWIFTDCVISHNTSDGLDLLYHSLGGTITLDRVRAEGNAGNQIKTMGETHMTNCVAVGNCGYFDGQAFTHNVDPCRAAGNALSIGFGSASDVTMVNSTVYSEGDCLVLIGGCDGAATFVSRNNVFLGGTDFLQPFESTCYTYSECGSLTFDQDTNVIDGTKNDDQCPWGANDICADPQLTGPLSGDAFGLEPAAGSPALDSGLDVGSLGLIPSVDFLGRPRPAGTGVDRGAYELQP
jgi:hypothetical protein